ncbi:MAG: porin [Propionivibrio sp.]|uniref:porin n=1 Tax=Propionivibrio sp. TaxID=2212460 RepID=UPI001A62E15B|nr:porin [Propionivibrio sp.]MBL8414494.1 porin [Propionivibrio sp.]
MQKKLIVLALAGLASSAAFAQTNVTIYGVIDEYIGYGSASQNTLINPFAVPVFGVAPGAVIPGSGGNQKFSGLQSGGLSGSRLGFKGEEALGNGLKAIFLYEFGSLDPSANDNGIGSTRQAYVGLNGKWGTFIGGKLQTPGYDAALKFDPMAASVFSPQLLISTNAGMTIQASSQGRVPNTIAYVSPNFSGFTGELVYSFGEQVTGTNWNGATLPVNAFGQAASNGFDKAQSVWGASLNYDNGPLAGSLAYHGLSNIGGTGNNPLAQNLKQTEFQVGLSYDFKLLKLFGSYQYIKQENFATLGGGLSTACGVLPLAAPAVLTGGSYGTCGLLNNNVKGNQWNIGTAIPVGANGAVKLAYTYYSNNIGNGIANLIVDDQKAQSFGIDYEYSFSKRTTAYAGYNYINNGANTNYGYPASGVKVTPGIDENAWMVGAGVRHTF